MALETEPRKNLQKELRQRCEELNELRKEAIELRSAASQTQKRMIEATRVLSPSLQISPHEVRFLLVCDVDSKRIRSLVAVKSIPSNPKELETRYDWLQLCAVWSSLRHPNILPVVRSPLC